MVCWIGNAYRCLKCNLTTSTTSAAAAAEREMSFIFDQHKVESIFISIQRDEYECNIENIKNSGANIAEVQ